MNRRHQHAALAIALALGSLACSACSHPQPSPGRLTTPAGLSASAESGAGRRAPETVETRFQMGTLVRIAVAAPDTDEVRAAIADAFDAIDAVIGVMSEWEPNSDITRVNNAGGGVPVSVDASLCEVLEIAREISEASEGAFDVSWAVFRDVWCFDPGCARVPDADELARASALVDYQSIEIDAAASTVRLREPGMQLGLGSIAKGYAIARAAQALRAAGYHAFIIDAGGDVYAAGEQAGEPWQVGIADPRGSDVIDVVQLRDAVIVTSGDYERYFELDGLRYHHIIDVRTGMPARGVVQVTVIADDPTVADGLATAAFVLGPERGLALLEDWRGVEGMVVDDGLGQRTTSGWPGANSTTPQRGRGLAE